MIVNLFKYYYLLSDSYKNFTVIFRSISQVREASFIIGTSPKRFARVPHTPNEYYLRTYRSSIQTQNMGDKITNQFIEINIQ